jgi:hypothetical protein
MEKIVQPGRAKPIVVNRKIRRERKRKVAAMIAANERKRVLAARAKAAIEIQATSQRSPTESCLAILDKKTFIYHRPYDGMPDLSPQPMLSLPKAVKRSRLLALADHFKGEKS